MPAILSGLFDVIAGIALTGAMLALVAAWADRQAAKHVAKEFRR